MPRPRRGRGVALLFAQLTPSAQLHARVCVRAQGIEEFADYIEVDPSVAEGLVALSTGTPTTTRGCLPLLISAMEMDTDTAQGILGFPNDDFTSIVLLAKKVTAQRPNSYEQVLNTLVCVPGLTSNQKSRMVEALDG